MDEKQPVNPDSMTPDSRPSGSPEDPLSVLREALESSEASSQADDAAAGGEREPLPQEARVRPQVKHLRRWILAIVLISALVVGLGLATYASRHHLAETRLGQWLGWEQEHQHELVPVQDEQGNIKYWTCTMHPSVRSKDPGTCPI